MPVEELQNPGSYNDFLAERNITHSLEAHSEFSTIIAGYRARLESERGVPEGGLHSRRVFYDENGNEVGSRLTR